MILRLLTWLGTDTDDDSDLEDEFSDEDCDYDPTNNNNIIFRSTKPVEKHRNIFQDMTPADKNSPEYPKLLRLIKDKNKYALLMGGDPEKNLRGSCNNDLKKLVSLIYNKYHVPYKNIYILTQKDSNMGILEKCNIYVMKQRTLSQTIKLFLSKFLNKEEKYFLFVAYSGHGHLLKREDTITTAFDTGLQIEEKLLLETIIFREIFFDKMSNNVNVFCLWDACHSGNNLDLPYEFDHKKYKWKSQKSQCLSKANIMSIGACLQTQFDVQVHYQGHEGGALTSIFAANKKYYYCLDNPQLVIGSMAKYMKNFGQKPVLSSTRYNKTTQIRRK